MHNLEPLDPLELLEHLEKTMNSKLSAHHLDCAA